MKPSGFKRGGYRTRSWDGVGAWGTQQMLMLEGSAPRSNPLPFYIIFFTKNQYPLRTPSIDKWYPFHIPCLEHCIYCKCTVS